MDRSIGTPIGFVNRISDRFLPDNVEMENKNENEEVRVPRPGSVGARVRECREGMPEPLNKTKDFAKKVGIAQSTLSELELGDSASSTHLPAIANAAEVSAYWLQTGKGEKYPKLEFAALEWVRRNELDMLNLFRGTDDDGREAILRIARTVPVFHEKPTSKD